MIVAPSAKRPARAKKAPVYEPPLELSHLRALRGDITDVGTLPGAWLRSPRDWPVVLSFDPGKCTGWCILAPHHAGIMPRFGHFDGGAISATFSECARHVLDEAHATARDADAPLLVAVESVFLHTGSPNIATALGLAFQVGALIGMCAEDAPVVRVLASQWQGAMWGRRDRAGGKKMSVELARARISRSIVRDHEADASLLALYVRGA